jgi:hypothetical protein
MSTGALQTVDLVVDLILKLQPESFLDVGIGSGKWGFLFREYTDIWEGRALKKQWKSQVDGIEAYAPIVEDYQRGMYKRIFIGNAYTLIEELHSYDFVWAFDLLSSFEKQRGLEMIRKMKEKTGVLLAVWQNLDEKVPMKSKSPNPYDARVSSWSLEDFSKAGFSYYKTYNNQNGSKDALIIYTEEDLGKLGLTKFNTK